MANAVEAYLENLDPVARMQIDALRKIVRASHDSLVEHIKWNAPSFMLDGEDRITLGLDRKGGVRLVLHRGAKARAADDFAFTDPAGLAAWPSPDRGVIQFRDVIEIEANADDLAALCARWLAAAV